MLLKTALVTVVRVLLVSFGGANLVSDSELETIIGGIVIAATTAWAIYENYKNKKKIEDAKQEGAINASA